MVLVQRSGDANDDGVHLGDIAVVRGGAKAFGLGLLDACRADADDVAAAGVEGFYFFCGDIEAGDAEAFVGKEEGKREAYVAHADDTDAGFAGFEFVLEGG